MKTSDKKTVDGFLKRIDTIGGYMSNVYKELDSPVDHEPLFEINEKLFNMILGILQQIKEQLNTPLNNVGLIFRISEEVDLDKIMTEIIEGG